MHGRVCATFARACAVTSRPRLVSPSAVVLGLYPDHLKGKKITLWRRRGALKNQDATYDMGVEFRASRYPACQNTSLTISIRLCTVEYPSRHFGWKELTRL